MWDFDACRAQSILQRSTLKTCILSHYSWITKKTHNIHLMLNSILMTNTQIYYYTNYIITVSLCYHDTLWPLFIWIHDCLNCLVQGWIHPEGGEQKELHLMWPTDSPKVKFGMQKESLRGWIRTTLKVDIFFSLGEPLTLFSYSMFINLNVLLTVG